MKRNVASRSAKTEKSVPVVVTMRVKCGCGHAEDETYEFDMPADQATPMEGYEPGTCPVCRAPIQIYLCRTSALQ
jgi:hypothetical protein